MNNDSRVTREFKRTVVLGYAETRYRSLFPVKSDYSGFIGFRQMAIGVSVRQ